MLKKNIYIYSEISQNIICISNLVKEFNMAAYNLQKYHHQASAFISICWNYRKLILSISNGNSKIKLLSFSETIGLFSENIINYLYGYTLVDMYYITT